MDATYTPGQNDPSGLTFINVYQDKTGTHLDPIPNTDTEPFYYTAAQRALFGLGFEDYPSDPCPPPNPKISGPLISVRFFTYLATFDAAAKVATAYDGWSWGYDLNCNPPANRPVIAAVPEPSSLQMMVIAGLCLILTWKFKTLRGVFGGWRTRAGQRAVAGRLASGTVPIGRGSEAIREGGLGGFVGWAPPTISVKTPGKTVGNAHPTRVKQGFPDRLSSRSRDFSSPGATKCPALLFHRGITLRRGILLGLALTCSANSGCSPQSSKASSSRVANAPKKLRSAIRPAPHHVEVASRPMVVTATVTLRKDTLALGEPIPVTFALRNSSPRPVTIWLCGFWPNHHVVVRDSTGKEPPLTAKGKECRAAFSPKSLTKNADLELRPGDVWKHEILPDLSALYHLSSGRYTVEVTYDERQRPDPIRVSSARIPFSVGLDLVAAAATGG